MRHCLGALLIVLLLSAAHPVRAQSLEIAPVSLELTPTQRATVITMVNHGAAPIVIQVRPFDWSQSGGADRLAPTEQIAVSPPFAQIAPEQEQTVRVVLRTSAGGSENSYRLLIDELPPAAAPGAIRFGLRLSVPVFVRSEQAGTPSLEWQLTLGSGGPTLAVRNRGQTHTKFAQIELIAGPARFPVATGGHAYVLAGSAMAWPIIDHGRLHAGDTVLMRAVSDRGPVEAALPVTNAH